MSAACAVLAAGISSRMGSDKALLLFEGRTLLERALAAAGRRPTAVVTSSAVAAVFRAPRHVLTLVNDEPQLGMSHSLALANAALRPETLPLVVLLVDTPLVDEALVERVVCTLRDGDVAFPVRGERRGHPVVFGPRARARIGALPRGDTLRSLRDDPELVRHTCHASGEEPFLDVDTPAEFGRLLRGETAP